MQRKRKKTPYEFQFQSTRISYLASLPFYWYFSVLPTFFINLFYWLSSSDSVFFYHSRTFMDSLRWVRVIMLNGWMERKTNFWRVIDPVYWMQFLISNDHAIFAFVTINFVFDESFRSTCFPAKWTVIKWGSVKSFPFFSLFPPQSKIIKLWLNATKIFVRHKKNGLHSSYTNVWQVKALRFRLNEIPLCRIHQPHLVNCEFLLSSTQSLFYSWMFWI